MDKDGSDPKNHDEEEIAQQPPPPPPLMLDEDSRVVAVIRNRISPAREGQPEPVLVRTIEPLPVAVPVRIANDIINGKYDDVQLSSSSPTEEAVANPVVDPDQGAAAAAAVVAVEQEPADEPVNQLTEEAVANSVVDPDQGAAAAVVAVKQEPDEPVNQLTEEAANSVVDPHQGAAAAAAVVAVKQEPADEPVNQLTEDVTKNLSFESISSTDSESENESDELPPAPPLPRGSRRPPTSPSGATGVSNRPYDHPYPIVRSGRFTNLADVPRVMQDDTERALREWESPTGNGNNINGSPADECRSVPAWQFRQRRPGKIAKTPPPMSDSEDDKDDDDDDHQHQEKLWHLLVTKARKINVQNVRTTPRETTFIENDPPIVPNDPPLLMRPFGDHMRILELMKRRGPLPPQQQRLVAMGPPPGLPGVLRTRVNSRVTPRRRHSQPSTGAPPLYAGQPPRRSSVPVNHLATNGTCSNGNGLAEGGWAARHCCENEDCRSFWQHLQECGLQLPPGWHVMLHEDARGRPHAYVVQLDVGANDMVPNLARSLMIDQHGRMQYFMYGAPVDASDNSLPEELNDLAALTEIVDVFARMNHEF